MTNAAKITKPRPSRRQEDAEQRDYEAFEQEFAVATAHEDIVSLRNLVDAFGAASGTMRNTIQSLRTLLPAGSSALVFNHLANLERLADTMQASSKDGLAALGRVRDTVEENALEHVLLEAAFDKADESATRDPLTGAYNRRYFDARFAKMMQAAKRDGTHLSVMFVDADHFKKVNDTHGHASGDEVLKVLARIMQGGVREGRDFVARYGGEEFVIVVKGTPKSALVAAERIRAAIENRAAYDAPNGVHVPAVTASMGVAHMGAKDTPESLLKRADDGVYEAKRNGRNRVMDMRARPPAASWHAKPAASF